MGQASSYALVTYYFNNYFSSQKQFINPRNTNFYSIEGSIVTDGSKGFINTTNIVSVNVSLKLGQSTIKNLYVSENDPYALFSVTEAISANNLFATESHIGIVETYRNMMAGNPYGSAAKNLTIYDLETGTASPFLFYKNQVNFSTPDVGLLFEYGCQSLSGNYFFYNYYEPTIGPAPDLGEYFSFFNSEDQIHMNNEMISDGYGMYAYNMSNEALSGTWVIASSVPEPSALSLLAVGLGGLAMMRRRRS